MIGIKPSVNFSTQNKIIRHKKAASVTNYNQMIESHGLKHKSNVFHQKPTYIILTIDGSGEKGSIKKKETPKASVQTLATTSYSKQGQSYQQLSSIKSTSKKKPVHNRTKSDHVLKAKPAINFLSYKKSNTSSSKKKGVKQSVKQSKNAQFLQSKIPSKNATLYRLFY